MDFMSSLKAVKNNSSKPQQVQYDGVKFAFKGKEVKVLERPVADHALKKNLWQVKGEQTGFGKLFSEVPVTAELLQKLKPEVTPQSTKPKVEQDKQDELVNAVKARLLAEGWAAPTQVSEKEVEEDIVTEQVRHVSPPKKSKEGK